MEIIVSEHVKESLESCLMSLISGTSQKDFQQKSPRAVEITAKQIAKHFPSNAKRSQLTASQAFSCSFRTRINL